MESKKYCDEGWPILPRVNCVILSKMGYAHIIISKLCHENFIGLKIY